MDKSGRKLFRIAILGGWMALTGTPSRAGAAYDSAIAPAGTELRVIRVVPEGVQVPAYGRQIVVTFDRAVVPLGAMTVDQGHSPVDVTPAVDCQWHWLDPRSLACDLDENHVLSPATLYKVAVRPGIAAQDGAQLSHPYQWSFATERPALTGFSFQTWRSPGTPVIRVVFNQPVTQDSVQSQLRFVNQPALRVTRDDGSVAPSSRVWVVEPAQELPLDSAILLSIHPGLRGAGPLPGNEHRTVVAFDTFPELQFLGVRCVIDTRSTLIVKNQPLSHQARCNPFGAVSLVFSAPVISSEIKSHLTLNPSLTNGRTDYDPWANTYPSSSLRSPHQRGREYAVELPERLQAFRPYAVQLNGVRDEFGRALTGTGAMEFRTDHRDPRLKVTHPVAVLEQDAPTSMPLYVTNLTGIDYQYRTLTPSGAAADLSSTQAIDRIWDQSYAAPAKIRELLSGGSGVVSGSLHPHPGAIEQDDELYPSSANRDRGFFAEVTPFEVHVKLGAFNTLVWITSLATGAPVAHARVRVYRDSYQGLTSASQSLGEAQSDKDGIAVLPGRQTLDEQSAERAPLRDTLMIRVDANGSLALLPLDDAFAIDTYRASRGMFWSDESTPGDHTRAWGLTAQGVYKLGDTIQYKVFLRAQNNLTLIPVAQREGYQLSIIDPTGKTVATVPKVTLSAFGAYAGSFRVPPSGAVGWYQFQLASPVGAARQPATWSPMRVLVADFTPAPFQVRNTLNGDLFQPGDSVQVATQATMHAGGPYASAGSRVTARLFPEGLDVPDAVGAGFSFASVAPSGACGSQAWPSVQTVHQSDAQVDDKGELTTRFQMPDAEMMSARLEVESAVRDERGKYVAGRSIAHYRGRDRYVGLRSDHWTFEEGKPATIQFLVIDAQGKVIPDAPVTITIGDEIVSAARVKGAGDAYLTSYQTQWNSTTACTSASSSAPQNCSFIPPRPGLLSVAAQVMDTQGRTHTSQMCVWVTGKGRVMWQEPADLSLSLVPEKPTYSVGERARYLVRNPFPGARALITIERFGVIKHWVQRLDGNTPVIDFKVEADFVPGFYLSVMVMSPRVAPPPGAATLDQDGVDLGRPTYRIGYVKVPVIDPYKTLDVAIKADKKSYKPRDTVVLDLNAKPRNDEAPRQAIEMAVVVLDEAVFDLIQEGKNYFDPYHGMYQLEALDLNNYTLLSRLVGLQKFEKKGANSGGDGGAGFDMRSITQYVAYWNPAVSADQHGRARVAFKLPDNLTGWRVFVVAVTPGDRLGLGDFKFKSTKLTELRPVTPNQLTAGDRFNAGFSVLNRSDRTRTIAVDMKAHGPIESGSAATHQTITLAPFKRETVWLPVTAVTDGSIRLTATAADGLDQDALAAIVPVHRRLSLDVAASYGTTLAAGVDEAIQFPADMMPGVGSLSVTMSPSVLGNLDGAFAYVRDYPYLCWEQRMTKAVLAANYLHLHDYLSADLHWPESAALPQTMLDDAATFQAPSGGMGFWGADNERVSPYLSAATALSFNRLSAAGYRVPDDVRKHLDDYLTKLLRQNTAPTFYSEGMVSSVRAVALLALAERGNLSLADLSRYEKYAPQMDLFGLASYLDAAVKIKGALPLARTLATQLLAHANQSAGQFHFSENWDDGYHQMLSSPLRSQCAILTALLHYGETADGAAQVGDIPFKLVRAITQARGNRDHWENTQENLYCTSALSDYAARYEKDPPAFSVRATANDVVLGTAKFTARRDPPILLGRPNGAADAGQRATVHLDRSGEGRLYYATRLSYSIKDLLARETNAGMEVHREYSAKRDGRWTLLTAPIDVKRGELLRVDIYLALPAARHFVVVDDPVPGGLEPVDRDLATASTVDADATDFQAAGGAFWFKFADWSEYGISLWNFYHRELRHDAARFYADYLPAGHYHLSYGAQAIAEGQFSAAPTRAEEMYDPDVYGKGMPAQVGVVHE